MGRPDAGIEDPLLALVADLQTVGPGATLRNALRRELGDPDLEITYVQAGSGGWINDVGRPMTTQVALAGRAVTPIERDGKPIAALVHDPALFRSPDRLAAAVRAVTLALDSEQLKADLRAQLEDVRASRARVLKAWDSDRRRVERDLHDGAQQRLVGIALTLRQMSNKLDADPAFADVLATAADELGWALGDLRELARGVHPAVITAIGLEAALETLAERPGVPVDLRVDLPCRLPDPVAVGVYYIVAEALANAGKHAQADRVAVRAWVLDDTLQVTVSDDGRGGAVPIAGSGLEGLADRVGALGGRLDVASPTGLGTTLSAAIPLGPRPGASRDPNRMAALKWMGWELWELPGEAYEQLTDEDNLAYAKGVFACAGGADRITKRERDWFLGFHSAAGDADWVLDAIRNYDGTDEVADILALPGMAGTGRAMLYDALRMCSSDGPLTAGELECVIRAADGMGLSHDIVADLRQVVLEENRLRLRRYDLIVAPALPA